MQKPDSLQIRFLPFFLLKENFWFTHIRTSSYTIGIIIFKRKPMIIHVIQPDETFSLLSKKYGISTELLEKENEIPLTSELVPGNSLVILYPKSTHLVREGDTLESIAKTHNITTLTLLQNNLFLSTRDYLYPGETIVIEYENRKHRKITTNGYIFPFTPKEILRQTLPYLTYVTLFKSQVLSSGTLSTLDDTDVIQFAKSFGVHPLLYISPALETETDQRTFIRNMINDSKKQASLMSDLLSLLKRKHYSGITLDMPYILPEERETYRKVLKSMAQTLLNEGLIMNISLNYSPFELLTGAYYTKYENEILCDEIDKIMVFNYQEQNVLGIPNGILSFDILQSFLNSVLTSIPAQKIFFGLPSNGFRWVLPYRQGITRATTLTHDNAVELAKDNQATIQYDTISQSPFYHYKLTEDNMVGYKDVRSIQAYLDLVEKNHLQGINFWGMAAFPSMLQLINARFEIEKKP